MLTARKAEVRSRKQMWLHSSQLGYSCICFIEAKNAWRYIYWACHASSPRVWTCKGSPWNGSHGHAPLVHHGCIDRHPDPVPTTKYSKKVFRVPSHRIDTGYLSCFVARACKHPNLVAQKKHPSSTSLDGHAYILFGVIGLGQGTRLLRKLP